MGPGVLVLVILSIIHTTLAMNEASVAALKKLNSSPNWVLVVRSGDGSGSRCVHFKRISLADEETFRAESTDRDASLMAHGDSSDALFFVYADRVESQVQEELTSLFLT